MPEISSRKVYIDIVKGIAILFVIITHIIPGFYTEIHNLAEALTDSVIFGFGRFCVPVFFMASGALLLREGRELSIKKLYTKNVFKLVFSAFLCGFLWTAYRVLVYNYQDGSYLRAMLTYVKEIACFRWGVPTVYWFVFAMTCMYVSLPILKVFADNADEKVMRYFLITWLVLSSIQNLSGTWYFSAFEGITDGFTFTGMFCGYAGYMILGKYVSEREFSPRERLYIYLAGAISAVVIIVEVLLLHLGYNVEAVDLSQYISMPVILHSLGVFIFAKYNFTEVRSFVGSGLSWLGKNTLPIYLLHCLFTYYFVTDKQFYFSIHPVIDPFIWLVICLGCTLVLVFIINALKRLFETFRKAN